ARRWTDEYPNNRQFAPCARRATERRLSSKAAPAVSALIGQPVRQLAARAAAVSQPHTRWRGDRHADDCWRSKLATARSGLAAPVAKARRTRHGRVASSDQRWLRSVGAALRPPADRHQAMARRRISGRTSRA